MMVGLGGGVGVVSWIASEMVLSEGWLVFCSHLGFLVFILGILGGQCEWWILLMGIWGLYGSWQFWPWTSGMGWCLVVVLIMSDKKVILGMSIWLGDGIYSFGCHGGVMEVVWLWVLSGAKWVCRVFKNVWIEAVEPWLSWVLNGRMSDFSRRQQGFDFLWG